MWALCENRSEIENTPTKSFIKISFPCPDGLRKSNTYNTSRCAFGCTYVPSTNPFSGKLCSEFPWVCCREITCLLSSSGFQSNCDETVSNNLVRVLGSAHVMNVLSPILRHRVQTQKIWMSYSGSVSSSSCPQTSVVLGLCFIPSNKTIVEQEDSHNHLFIVCMTLLHKTVPSSQCKSGASRRT